VKHIRKAGRTFVCSSPCPTPDECGAGCRRIDAAIDTAPDIEPVPEARRIGVNPGDLVVLSFPGHLTQAQAARIRTAWADAHPNVKAVILEGGLTLDAVLEPGTPEADALEEAPPLDPNTTGGEG
jgi:hypothetical protein